MVLPPTCILSLIMIIDEDAGTYPVGKSGTLDATFRSVKVCTYYILISKVLA